MAKAGTKAGVKKTAAKSLKRAGSELRDYAAKRDFSKTAEPRAKLPKAETSGNRFVVQKHDARRLHFDLRLELAGVLKSWAVTKGPSMHAGVRRLAVQTEDHPLAYKDWEGVIPKGEYGGGTMIVWDMGTWKAEGDAQAALAKGKLNFELKGKRLKGSWSLVRMKTEEKRTNWLLIKRTDQYALAGDAPEPVETEMDSVKSGKTNAGLEKAKALRQDHKGRAAKSSAMSRKKLAALPQAKKGILPAFVEPSLAVLVPMPPKGDEWIHEIKHDGYRIEARIEGSKVQLLTRTGLDWAKRFPTVVASLKQVPVKAALIDGEIVVQDEAGHSTFAGLQADLKAGRHDRIAYYVFDLMHCDGADLRTVPLIRRKEMLAELVAAAPHSKALQFNEHLEEPEQDILSHACRLGLEGIVSKQAQLPYISGRGPHWLKSKCMLRQEFVITGFVPATDRPNAVGSLVLAYNENGNLRYAGRSGTGYSDEESVSLYRTLLPLKAEKPSFSNTVAKAMTKGVVWVKPELVAEIEYRGRTTDGLVRQAAFVGLREDKPAASIVLEEPELIPKHHSTKASAELQFTHPEKVLWHDAGITKQDLGNYYLSVAERMLPHIKDRPLSFLRCPDGTAGKCFFARHAWMGVDKSIRLIDTGDEKPMLAIRDLRGLLSLVQMGVLEIHAWGSTAQAVEKPDRIIFDLDPGEDVSWNDIRMAALELKSSLEAMSLIPFLKTSGGKGLHVVVPILPELEWDAVKNACKAIAQQMVVDQPFRYVASMSKSRRKGRIFIDYLRNAHGATAVAPFSTRARAGAPVATPIGWDELPGLEAGNQFTLRNFGERLSELKSDPWADIDKARQPLRITT
jgi:bifunctional non-homologous end joining protein LigD